MALLGLLFCFILLGASPGSGAPAGDPELSITPRIINGTDPPLGSSPWLVALMTAKKSQFCWGALINRTWVLTAAHCNVTTSDLVGAGLYDPRSFRKGIQVLKIAQVFVYPQLHWTPLDNDVALVQLASPANFSKRVSPAVLPAASKRFRSGRQCVTMGWGLTHPNGSKKHHEPQQAMVPLLTNRECRKSWGKMITPSKICAGADCVSSWEVDSGGPLVCRKEKVWTLVGIMSFMSEACPTVRPLVFTRVTSLIPWIQETVGKAEA
ncbi:Chymotrypsinogen B [Galemys pyrenaicus]|uniref:Chymotrypsinogen B n=1 Tax=Galemys pyrenaicus TaxID=202257 RepID=A0A8J6DEF2_GALPY|nr:Chymotrypsinogen B [Galemys pyrenaicus]